MLHDLGSDLCVHHSVSTEKLKALSYRLSPDFTLIACGLHFCALPGLYSDGTIGVALTCWKDSTIRMHDPSDLRPAQVRLKAACSARKLQVQSNI